MDFFAALSPLAHNHPDNTCVCKDRDAHREFCLTLLKERMLMMERIVDRARQKQLEEGRGRADQLFLFDIENLPDLLLHHTALILKWKENGDRLSLLLGLFDLAAYCVQIGSESAHWNMQPEDTGLLYSVLDRIVQDRLSRDLIGEGSAREEDP